MQKLSGLFLMMILTSGVFTSSFAFAQVSPVAEDDFYSVDEDTLLSVDPIGVLQNDTNTQSDTFLAVLNTNVSFGTLVLNSNGSFTYQPNQDFDSTDSFTYFVNNGTHNSNNATVTISVNPVNDAPVAHDDLAETQINVPVSIDVLGNDLDVENDTLSIVLEVGPISQTKGSVEINGSEILFTPIADFVGNTTFSYHVSDGDKESGSALVTITVSAQEEDPDEPVFEQILGQIQKLLDKITSLENSITELREENAALALRVADLESHGESDSPPNDDDDNNAPSDDEGGNEKITICHKGKNTISVSENALPAHLRHGDSEGKC